MKKKQLFAILVEKINGITWVCCNASIHEVVNYYTALDIKIVSILKINLKWKKKLKKPLLQLLLVAYFADCYKICKWKKI